MELGLNKNLSQYMGEKPKCPYRGDMWVLTSQMDVGTSPVHPENPPMTGGGKGRKLTLDQNGREIALCMTGSVAA
jgi:hypothetical protein